MLNLFFVILFQTANMCIPNLINKLIKDKVASQHHTDPYNAIPPPCTSFKISIIHHIQQLRSIIVCKDYYFLYLTSVATKDIIVVGLNDII